MHMLEATQKLTDAEAKLLAALNERPRHFQLVGLIALRGLERRGLAAVGKDLYVRVVAS